MISIEREGARPARILAQACITSIVFMTSPVEELESKEIRTSRADLGGAPSKACAPKAILKNRRVKRDRRPIQRQQFQPHTISAATKNPCNYQQLRTSEGLFHWPRRGRSSGTDGRPKRYCPQNEKPAENRCCLGDKGLDSLSTSAREVQCTLMRVKAHPSIHDSLPKG